MLGLALGLFFSLVMSVCSTHLFTNIRSTPPLLSLILIIALYIPFSSIFLLPVDLISSSVTDTSSFFYVESKKLILNLWRVNYWLGFGFTWLVLPLVQCFYSSNNYVFNKRLNDSIVYNLKFYSVYLIVGIIGCVYVYISVGLNTASIKSLVIVLSHSYSLILAIWFMGYGLVNLPKTLFWDSFIIRLSNRYFVSHYYATLLTLKDEYHDARTNFYQIVGLIRNLHSISELQNNPYHKDWIEYLYRCVESALRTNKNINFQNSFNDNSNLQSNLTNYNNRFNSDLNLVNNQLSDESLLSITKDFKDAYYRFLINESLYYRAIKKVIKIQDIKTSTRSHSLNFRAPNKTHSKFSINYLINNVLFKSSRSKYWYYYYLNPFSLKVFGLLMVIFTVLVVISEIFHNSKFSIINFMIFHKDSPHNWLTTLFILCLLSYMSFCALISLSKTKIFFFYKLIPKNSNPSSCVWYSSYAIRLTIPLCYNFLTLLNKQILSGGTDMGSHIAAQFSKSQFALFLGNSINMIAIGQTANNILPYFVLVPVAIQLYKIKMSHSKILKRPINLGDSMLDEPSFFTKIRSKISGVISDFGFLLFDELSDDDNESNYEYETSADYGPSQYSDTEESTNPNDPLLYNPFQDSASEPDRLSPKVDLIVKKVETLIDQELKSPKSLLNTYDDNYNIFFNSSLEHYLSKMFGKSRGAVSLSDDREAEVARALQTDDLEFEFDGDSDEE